MTAAIFNLNHHAGYLHWHFIQISIGNAVVIGVMVVLFVVALLAPFPGSDRRAR
jgi:hypothetical protein